MSVCLCRCMHLEHLRWTVVCQEVSPRRLKGHSVFLCDLFWFCSCFTHYAADRSLANHMILMFEPKDVQSSLGAFKVCFVFVDVCACLKKGEIKLFVLFISLIKIW